MKKILYVINVDWFFVSHFLPIGLEGLKKEYEVHIACEITDKKELFEKLGFIVHPLSITRSGKSFKKEIKTVIEIYKLIRFIKPHITEFFTIKPVIYGGIVSRFCSIQKKVFYITGLGYVFIAKGWKGFFVRNIVKSLYKLAIKGKHNSIITENIYDKELIRSLNVVEDNQIKIIRGAGVNLKKYNFVENENNDKIIISMACRLLKDKGVFEYLEAAKIIKNKFSNVEFYLYGDIDLYNPASLTKKEVRQIEKNETIKISRFTNNIAEVFSKSNIVVLPSYREGLPKVLVEAAACGRAVVTTDAPGCRDAIEPNITGLLCKVRDSNSLANELVKLIVNRNLRKNMGYAGRKLAEKEFDIKKITKKHFEVYDN